MEFFLSLQILCAWAHWLGTCGLFTIQMHKLFLLIHVCKQLLDDLYNYHCHQEMLRLEATSRALYVEVVEIEKRPSTNLLRDEAVI
jgi:hypothetical protein